MDSDKKPHNIENNNKDSCDKYLTFFCWFFSIIIWGLIILAVMVKYKSRNENIAYIIYAIIFAYIIYLIVEFCSSTSKYLCHKSDSKGIEYQMEKYFRAYPIISFHCTCYHYETRKYRKRTRKGRYVTHTKRVRVVTHTDSYNLHYKSSRDVSGLFNLNCDSSRAGRIDFIKLYLRKEINFADSISVSDYTNQKDSFWRKNRFRDTYMDFREERTIPGLIEHNLVNINGKDPCSINIYWFVFFTFLTLVQFYKSYVNCFCITQNFTIRKLISTRYDLNSEQYDKQYENLIPRINLIKSHISYDNNQYNYVNIDENIDLPTKKEIEDAEKKYRNKVPVYEIYQKGENDTKRIIRAGTIKDNIQFSTFNSDEAPPAFAQVAGNVGISSEQINREGTLPEGFDKPGFKFSIVSIQESDIEDENKEHPSATKENTNLKVINYENINENEVISSE